MQTQLSLSSEKSPDHLNCLINETQAAEYLGYTIRALQNWRLRGGGPQFIKVSARSIRYRRCDLNEWIEAHVRQHTSEEQD
ncbi:MAG: helix-turn-helix transcriptional regulator [Alphaproteobacteria bacterium]